MFVGKTVSEIFGNLPDEAGLQSQTGDQRALSTNVHVHLPPNFGSIQSIEHALTQATAEGIAVLGACNYYDHTIYETFARQAIQAGIVPVFGIEILTLDEHLQKAGIRVNDPQNAGKVYICGKGLTCFDCISGDIQITWERIRQGDKQRITAMIGKLNAVDLLKQKGISLTYEGIAQTIADEKHVPVSTVFLQERHVAQALQRAIFEKVADAERSVFLQQLYQVTTAVETQNVVKIQDDLRSVLLKQGRVAYVGECFITPQEGANLIIGLGGYVSYPILIDGAPQILPGEGTPDELIARLLAQQIGAAEFIPTRNDPQVLLTYARALRQQGIVLGAGTEHNAAVWIPLLPACKKGVPLGDELTAMFWEGACVAVAHQYLRAKGQEGFRFLPDVAAREAQIQRLSSIGARVIALLKG